MPPELDAVAEALKEGRAVEPVQVRVFLSWFDAQRRGMHVVRYIREQMQVVGVETDPDFEAAWIETPVTFHLTSKADAGGVDMEPAQSGHGTPNSTDASTAGDGDAVQWVSRDPTYRISKLEAANAGVLRVTPDEPISRAVTLMLSRDYSQLPVMTTDREVKGLISWRSVGSRLAMGNGPERVRDAIEQAYEVPAEASIFDAITLIVRHGHVLVRSYNNSITGIVTASDLSMQFRTLTEPFLVLSEIENLVRNMIGARFTPEELAEARDSSATGRPVASIADLTFGEYVRLLEKPERWNRLNLGIDRDLFCKDLDRVRKIRNDVMHFDPDGITGKDLAKLQTFAQFLQRLDELRVQKTPS